MPFRGRNQSSERRDLHLNKHVDHRGEGRSIAAAEWESRIKGERIKAALAIRMGQGRSVSRTDRPKPGYRLIGEGARRRYVPDWHQRAVKNR